MTQRLIAEVLERLRSDMMAANGVGNLDGLLARHIVGDDPRLRIAWEVNCNDDWVRDGYDPSSLPSVAALGYTVMGSHSDHLIDAMNEGLLRAVARDPSLAGNGAALHDPAVLVGLALASRSARENIDVAYRGWCTSVVKALATSNRTEPLLAYAAHIVGAMVTPPLYSEDASIEFCSAYEWWCHESQGKQTLSLEQQQGLRASLLDRSLAELSGTRTAHQAALLWRSLRLAIGQSSADLLQSASSVAAILGQFESCLRRWRWDALERNVPIRWPIHSEREVQDILWMMLRGVFPDLEDEDTLPKFGHSTYRADLGVPSLGLLVEVKFARSAGEFKDIEKQVLEDIVPYLRTPERYREVVVFIYDDSASVQEHETTRNALLTVQGIADVIVVSRPSHLPARKEREQASKVPVNPRRRNPLPD